MKKLTKAQKIKLVQHTPHHTQAHMQYMRREMLNGKSFSKAHKEAIKKVGK